MPAGWRVVGNAWWLGFLKGEEALRLSMMQLLNIKEKKQLRW
jgi:hypothetical protein